MSEKPTIEDERKEAEETQMRILQNLLNAFIAHPIKANEKLVVERMGYYQDAWIRRRSPAPHDA